MFCVKCGASLPDDANFCFKCGCDLRNLSQSPRTCHSFDHVPSVSEYITFGRYPQNNGNIKEPIEWLVLEVNGNELFLISRYGLERQIYHHDEWFKEPTWEKCDLRRWLNNEFLNTAFSESEQKRIIISDLPNNDNSVFGTKGGERTRDKIFCLSLEEAKKWGSDNGNLKAWFEPVYFGFGDKPDYMRFGDNPATNLVCTPTALAHRSNDQMIDGHYVCSWWLRSPGKHSCGACAAIVLPIGWLSFMGGGVYCNSVAVRPALRITL